MKWRKWVTGIIAFIFLIVLVLLSVGIYLLKTEIQQIPDVVLLENKQGFDISWKQANSLSSDRIGLGTQITVNCQLEHQSLGDFSAVVYNNIYLKHMPKLSDNLFSEQSTPQAIICQSAMQRIDKQQSSILIDQTTYQIVGVIEDDWIDADLILNLPPNSDIKVMQMLVSNGSLLFPQQARDIAQKIYQTPLDNSRVYHLSNAKLLLNQLLLLAAALGILFLMIFLLIRLLKQIGMLCQKQTQRQLFLRLGITGGLLLICLLVFIILFGKIMLPEQFLPPKNLFHIQYYVDLWRNFNIDRLQASKGCIGLIQTYQAYRNLCFILINGFIVEIAFFIMVGFKLKNRKNLP